MIAIQILCLYLALAFFMVVFGYAKKKLAWAAVGATILWLPLVGIFNGGIIYQSPAVVATATSFFNGTDTITTYTYTTHQIVENTAATIALGIMIILLIIAIYVNLSLSAFTKEGENGK